MNNNYSEILNRYVHKSKVDEDVSKYHTFRIKGKADIVLLPESLEDLKDMLHFCRTKNYNHALIGNGSNILFNNGIYRGILITTRLLKSVKINGDTMYCECGVPLPLAAAKALNSNLSGLERLGGIPGTLGGALVMNAGAYGSEIKDVLVSVCVYDKNDKVYDLTPEELDMSYRHTIIKERELTVLSCILKLLRIIPSGFSCSYISEISNPSFSCSVFSSVTSSSGSCLALETTFVNPGISIFGISIFGILIFGISIFENSPSSISQGG